VDLFRQHRFHLHCEGAAAFSRDLKNDGTSLLGVTGEVDVRSGSLRLRYELFEMVDDPSQAPLPDRLAAPSVGVTVGT
jgi:hypothetical protein